MAYNNGQPAEISTVLPTAKTGEIELVTKSLEELQALFENELRFRRVFVAGKFLVGERERCSLLVVHPLGGRFSVEAEAVYINRDETGAGVGLDLVGLDANRLAQLEAFVRQTPEPDKDEAVEPVPEQSPPQEDAAPNGMARNAYERIRGLPLREREKVARRGQLADRIALERSFGSTVWEGLLQNPMLTIPEVAQIAKKGALPQALVATIVANAGWLASGEVRRALLGNPRVSGAQLDRVLRATPKAELKQIAQVSPYRSQVRAAAKKISSE
jgi:hypothetical protein